VTPTSASYQWYLRLPLSPLEILRSPFGPLCPDGLSKVGKVAKVTDDRCIIRPFVSYILPAVAIVNALCGAAVEHL